MVGQGNGSTEILDQSGGPDGRPDVKLALRQSAPIMAFSAARKLWADYGYLRSAREGRCVDANGRPIPWYTYASVWYSSNSFSDKDVFEYVGPDSRRCSRLGSDHAGLSAWKTMKRRFTSSGRDSAPIAS